MGAEGLRASSGGDVFGSGSGDGLHGSSTLNTGVQGIGSSFGLVADGGYATGDIGVIGTTHAGFPQAGVYGSASASAAVQGFSTNSMGIWGHGFVGVKALSTIAGNDATNSKGVFANATGASGSAVDAICNYGCASSNNGLAGMFHGDVALLTTPNVVSNLTVSPGNGFKPNGGLWIATSDARVKRDVRPFKLGLAELLKVRPVFYKYNGLGGMKADGKEYSGVIAQELETVLPFMVTSKKAKLRETDTTPTDIKHVDPSAFTFLLINAVKEQHTMTEAQDARLGTLEAATPVTASVIPALFASPGGCVVLGLLALGMVVAAVRRPRAR
jgi:hypothetical protein